jgi:hypothetical protein
MPRLSLAFPQDVLSAMIAAFPQSAPCLNRAQSLGQLKIQTAVQLLRES